MRCEDFPCCGHEAGCCPDYDASGRQLNMICTCGAVLPITNKSSICNECLDHYYNEEEGGCYNDHDYNDYLEYMEGEE